MFLHTYSFQLFGILHIVYVLCYLLFGVANIIATIIWKRCKAFSIILVKTEKLFAI